MRLRVLVPRRRRAGSLGGLAEAGLRPGSRHARRALVFRTARLSLALAAALVLAACGGGEEERQAKRPGPAPVPRFAIGIDERNPHLLAPGDQPAPFGRFRDALAALQPSYVRILVDWSVIQPEAGTPPDLAQFRDGCVRTLPPCAPYQGFRDTLRGVIELGARPVVLIYGTPAWAARPPAGCERDGVTPYARTPRLEPYRVLVRALRDHAEEQGIERPLLSPWNEPNTPIFLNPQRRECDRDAPSLAVGRYEGLVRAAADEWGLDRIVLGEPSGILRHTRATGAGELAEGLPDDLVCGAVAWAQHAYVTSPSDEGRVKKAVPLAHNARVLDEVKTGLDSHGCERPVPIWITETGAGDRPGACRAMAAQLRAWRRDPRIRAAFQYTMRDDPLFPVGLADSGLTRLFPAYEAWRTRGDSC